MTLFCSQLNKAEVNLHSSAEQKSPLKNPGSATACRNFRMDKKICKFHDKHQPRKSVIMNVIAL